MINLSIALSVAVSSAACSLIVNEDGGYNKERVINEVKRGATFIPVRGAYKNKEGQMLLCVVRRAEYYMLKNIIHTTDPNAFVITSEASQVLGEGFEPIIKKR